MSEERFDYAKAMAELEGIATRIEDPKTSLDEIGGLVTRSNELIGQCRDYLRSVRESIEDKEDRV